MTIIELFYWITGSVGVVLSAQGLTGLRLRDGATRIWGLTDPLGRFDFHFSEGQFDLIVDRLKRDLLLTLGALSLLVSLVLSAAERVVQSYHVVSATSSWLALARIGAICAGCLACIIVRLGVNWASVEYSAIEIEARASVWITERPERKDILRQVLDNWFERRTNRKPRIDKAATNH